VLQSGRSVPRQIRGKETPTQAHFPVLHPGTAVSTWSWFNSLKDYGSESLQALKKKKADAHAGTFSSGKSGNRSFPTARHKMVGSDEQLWPGLLFPAWNCMLSSHLFKSLSRLPLVEKISRALVPSISSATSSSPSMGLNAILLPACHTLTTERDVILSKVQKYSPTCFSALHNLRSRRGDARQRRRSLTCY